MLSNGYRDLASDSFRTAKSGRDFSRNEFHLGPGNGTRRIEADVDNLSRDVARRRVTVGSSGRWHARRACLRSGWIAVPAFDMLKYRSTAN